MKRVVLDASITVASCVGEEEAAGLSDAVLELLHEGVAVVPGVWLGEVANVFVSKERTGRREHKLTAEETSAFLAFVGRLPVVIDWTTQETTFGAVAKLARESGLSIYDALYLELAKRLGVPLGSLDGDLCAAARSVGVQVVTPDLLEAWEQGAGE